jgi:hypothetical protein
MSDCRLPIHDLVETRLKELGMRRGELVRRCGFKNVGKGIRRIEAMCSGDLDSLSARMILKALPKAIDVGEDVVGVAVCETADSLNLAAADREAAWRTSFRPHGYLCGTEPRPLSNALYCFCGGPERLRIPLDCSQPAVTYTKQALAVVRKMPSTIFFGPTTGFFVNYAPDFAVRFDLNGHPVEAFPRAYSPGEAELQIGRSKISSENFGRIMGFIPK